jgi:integrase
VDLTLKVARGLAADIRAQVRAGKDPAAKRAALTASRVTFATVCDAFVREELPAMRRTTETGWRRYIDSEIKPYLGKVKPEAVTSDHVAKLKARIAKRAAVSADRCFEVVRRICEWASTADPDVAVVRERYGIQRLEVNPAAAARGYRRRRGNGGRAAASAKAYTDAQLRAIYAAAKAGRPKKRETPKKRPARRRIPMSSDEGRVFADLLDLIAHTGVRAHDARSARWENVDTDRELWTIPQHKTSDTTGAPHVVPLSSGALAVLARIRTANMAAGRRSPWVFPANSGPCEVCGLEGHTTKELAKHVKKDAGIGGRGLLHRLRDTLKTRMSEHGIDGRVSEAILAHARVGIEGVYDHAELLPQRREALEWWSGELARILAGDKAAGEKKA